MYYFQLCFNPQNTVYSLPAFAAANAGVSQLRRRGPTWNWNNFQKIAPKWNGEKEKGKRRKHGFASCYFEAVT